MREKLDLELISTNPKETLQNLLNWKWPSSELRMISTKTFSWKSLSIDEKTRIKEKIFYDKISHSGKKITLLGISAFGYEMNNLINYVRSLDLVEEFRIYNKRLE